MSDWGLLDEKEEQELHKHRLLSVEEKSFKRLTKRLLGPDSLSIPRPQTALLPTDGPPTPPADATAADVSPRDETSKAGTTAADARLRREQQAAQYREDVCLDFAAFDGFAWRQQCLLTGNEAERARYRSDQLRISEECAAVRRNCEVLRARLEEARATLATRRHFDELADKITSSKLLRPRAEQLASIQKLDEECAELEKEKESYAETWRERRAQFARIVEEGIALRRLIRDEKDESDRREGMHDEDAGAGTATGAGGAGGAAAAGAATPKPDSQTATGAATSQEGTPRRGSVDALAVPKPQPDGLGHLRSRSVSPSGSHHADGRTDGERDDGEDDEREEGEADDGSPDVDMLDARTASATQERLGVDADTRASVAGTPRITVDQLEEGEEDESGSGDRMDTT